MHELAVVIVSHNSAHWLEPCLRTLYDHLDGVASDVVVVNSGTDTTEQLVREAFPAARLVPCENRGFAHANNRGLVTCDARYVLFLNPDTQITEGTFRDLLDLLDREEHIGAVSVKQVLPDGDLFPTIRRFPNALRQLGEALGSERIGGGRWIGERVLAKDPYERSSDCDWATGAFMLVRREALESAGCWDERFFLGSEETDLWLRIRNAGWRTMHVPDMTIIHHAVKDGVNEDVEVQYTFSRLQYADRHMTRSHRLAFRLALAVRLGLRALLPASTEDSLARRSANRRGLKVLAGLERPPFGEPPAVAMRPRVAGPTGTPPRAEEPTGEPVRRGRRTAV